MPGARLKPPRLRNGDRGAGMARGWRRAGPVIAAAGAAAAGVALFFLDPANCGLVPQCLFHRITGLDCPLCGGLRAAHALLHGNVGEAFRLNPLFVAAGPVLAVLAVHTPRALHPWTVRVLVGGVLAFWIVRNLRG